MLSNLNSYQLNQGGKKYILTTSLVINSIRVTCRDANGQIYNRDFTIEDLKTLSTIFDMIKTPLQALEYIDKALKVQEVGVEQQNGIIKIIFFNKTNGINSKVEVPLGKVGPEFLSSVQKLLKNGEFITLPFHPKKLLGEINSIKQSSTLNNLGPITFDKNDNKLLVELQGQQTTASNINKFVTTSENKYIPSTQVTTSNINEYIPTTQTTISNISGNIPTKQATTTTTTTQIVSNYIPSSSEAQLSNFAPAISTTKTPITNIGTFDSFSQPSQIQTQTQTRIETYDNAGGDSATQLSFQELVPNNISQLIPETTTSAAIDSTNNLGGLEYTNTQTAVSQYPTYGTTTTQQVSNLPKTTISSTTQRKAYTLPTTNIPNFESPFPKTTIPRIQQSQTNANAFDINKLLKNEPLYSQTIPGQTTSRAKSYDSRTYNITPMVRPSAPKTSYESLASGYGMLSPQKTSTIQKGYLSPKAQRINIPIEKGFDLTTNVTSEVPQYQTVSNIPQNIQTSQIPTTSQDFDYQQYITNSQETQTQNENQFPGTIQTLQIPTTTTQEYINKSQAVQTQNDAQIATSIQTSQIPTTSPEFDYQQYINKSQAVQTQNENQFPGTIQTLQMPSTSQEFDYQQYINKSQAVQTQNDTTQVSRPIQTSQIPTTSQDFDYQQYINKSQAVQTQNENQFPGTIQTLQMPSTSPEFDYQQYINKSQAVQTQNDTTQVSRPIQTVDSLQQPKINELYQYRNVPRIPQNVDKVQFTQETSYSQVPQLPISHQISQIPDANINIPSQRKLIIPIKSTVPDYNSPITLSLPRTHDEQENIREEQMEYNQDEYQQEQEPRYELNPVPSLPQMSPLDLNKVQFVKSTQTINELLNRASQANLDEADNYEQFRTTTRRTQNQIFSNPQPQIMSPLQQSMVTNYNDDRIKKLLDDTDSLKNKHHFLKDKLNELTGKINSYKYKIKAIEDEKKLSEVNALKAENEVIKQQISELSKLKDSSAEVKMLRDQLKELDPLRQKAYELELLKGRLNEINDLRDKVNELSGVKDQLGEIENLKLQISQMSDMEEQLGELSTLRIQAADAENLRRKIEQMETERVQYEEEIKSLRNTQRLSDLRNTGLRSNISNILSPGMESKHLFFEEKQQSQYIKGDIIHNMNELEMITRKINKSNGKITLNLLYKATADSDKASAFHERCDDANSTLVLVETDKGKRFGGFTACSWRGECIEKKDEEAFVFSLDKMMVYENIPGEDAIGCYPKFGPIFLGCQIRIYDNAFSKGGTTFEKGLNYNTEEDYELTGGDRTFGVKEIEVYEVIAQ